MPSLASYLTSLTSAKQQEASDVANTGAQAATGPSGDSVDPYSGVNASLQHAQSKVPEDQKAEANKRSQEYKDRTKNYLSGKFPQERRDQTIYRLKKMILEIQGHRDCKLTSILHYEHR